MANKNIQMRERAAGIWNNLFPITVAKNVLNTNGVDVETQFGETVQYADDINKISPKKINFVAHRGFSELAPENSKTAFELAASNRGGFWGIETDLRRTSDGHWVCMHDATINRTTTGTGNVSSYTLAQLAAFDLIGSGEKIPTFDEYLNICLRSNLVPIIELKETGNLALVVEKIIARGLEYKCVIISGTPGLLNTVRALNKRIKMQYLVSTIDQTQINLVKTFRNCAISCNITGLTEANVAMAHAQGLEVATWTVDNVSDIIRVMGYGVDYITTNKGASRVTAKEKAFTIRKTSGSAAYLHEAYSTETATLTWDAAREETKLTYDAPFRDMVERGAIAFVNSNVTSKDRGFTFATRSETADSLYFKCYLNGVAFHPLGVGTQDFWLSIMVREF